VTRLVMTNLAFVNIAIEELRPRYMRGSGAVPEDAIDELDGRCTNSNHWLTAWNAMFTRS